MPKARLQVQPVILCGGSGTRLWPLSRSGFPKQFLCLTGEESLFQQSARRLAQGADDGFDVAPVTVVCNEEHRFLVSEQLREVRQSLGAALLEPEGRNTAPAMTLAALAARERDADAILVVTPADQTVAKTSAFTAAIGQAVREAATGAVVVLGIMPDRPETGYGYIKGKAAASGALLVERFVEKPDAAHARAYLDEGNFFWNAGIFVIKASVWLAAIQAFRPDIAARTRSAWDARSVDGAFVRPGKEEFLAIPAESVDYAVMERCPGSGFPVRMVGLDAGWSDLGAWDAVWQVLPKDEHGNAQFGDVCVSDSQDTLVHASSRLVAAVGVRNLVVVETADAVLVADRSRSQDVKNIVARLDAEGRQERTLHRKVHRPWGWFDTIDEGSRFKVKRILVNPKASLSLQKHAHRAEHWVVVAGVAEVTCGDKTTRLGADQSIYIPLGHVHRLANPGDVPLEIVEVQSGDYLGEDDIVRMDDRYGRTGQQ